MKTEELKELGLNEDQIKSVMAFNGKDIEAAKAPLATQLKDAETARDGYKADVDSLQGQLDTANATLDSFKDLGSADDIKAKIEDYKKQAADAEAKYTKDVTQRDQSAWLDTKFDELGVTSPYARTALKADIMCADEGKGLPWREGAFFGFNDYMAQAKAKDNSLYMSEEEKKAAEAAKGKEDNPPGFAGPTGGNGKEGEGSKAAPRLF